jgi:uncharacterized protein (TIGR03000 family)
MYSLVLMTAFATTGDTASFHWRSAGCCGGAPVVRSAPVIYTVGCYGCTGCTGCTGCGGYVVGPVVRQGCGCTGWSCTGCCGGGCCGGIVTWATPARVAPPMAAPEPAAPKAAEKKPASIELELPADATLFVDGRAVPGSGAKRSFATPELPAGRSYYYDMAAEILVDGTPVRQELRVHVAAGETLQHSFGDLIAKAKSAKPATVATK